MAWRMYALYRVPSSYISLDAVKLTAQVLKHLSHSCNDATDIGTNQNHSTCRAPKKRIANQSCFRAGPKNVS